MSITQKTLDAIQANIGARLDQAGIEYECVRILAPGVALAPEWNPANEFDSQYPGWRVHLDADLTDNQRSAIAAAVANLDITDYTQSVADAVQEQIAALPALVSAGSFEEIAAWYNSLAHGTETERLARLETVLPHVLRLLVVLRDIAAAELRAGALRDL